jgi:phage tail protein X
LPADCFWLRLSGRGELDLLAGLVGVWTNGLSALRLGECPDEPLAPGRIRAALEATPGLAAVRQPWPSSDLQPRETTTAWTTRVAERLRHRARALTPWDCERLVLQAFPEVFKLKCIPRSDTGPDEPVLVVVVPALTAGYDIDGTEAPRLDASTLQRIAQFLGDRMPPHQPLLVRNASYERIQVRCTLRLARGEPAGERLRELNQSLRDYLSPWRPGGITTQFDWQLRTDDVEAFLRAQPGVDAIGQASLLHIVLSDQAVYRLSDTARGDRVVRPAQPWSLALPTRGHLLDLLDAPAQLAQPSGLSKLTIASSFIISGEAA